METESAEVTGPSGHRGPTVGSSKGYRVIDCSECGWAHLDPVPTPEELEALYVVDYHDEPAIEKERAEQAYWDLEHAWKLDTIAEALCRTGRILDVGCGIGLFVEYAAHTGWEAVGIEPSTEAVEAARLRGLDVQLGTWERTTSAEVGRFDAVHCKLVLEHLADPRGFVTWARNLLVPGGVLCLHAPNEFNVLQRAVLQAHDKPPWWIAGPFHINYFTFDSIEALAAGAGLEPFDRQATFPMELFVLLGFDYIGNDTVGSEMHGRRMQMETTLRDVGAEEVRRALYRDLARLGLGREAIVYARTRAG
jgi:SAM-dependent methyltransferase